jgi:hypothetical protein
MCKVEFESEKISPEMRFWQQRNFFLCEKKNLLISFLSKKATHVLARISFWENQFSQRFDFSLFRAKKPRDEK